MFIALSCVTSMSDNRHLSVWTQRIQYSD